MLKSIWVVEEKVKNEDWDVVLLVKDQSYAEHVAKQWNEEPTIIQVRVVEFVRKEGKGE